jgi:hypothetical protein
VTKLRDNKKARPESGFAFFTCFEATQVGIHYVAKVFSDGKVARVAPLKPSFRWPLGIEPDFEYPV